MNDAPSTHAEKIGRFWDKYLNRLEQRRVKPDARRWYRRRAEAFIRAMKLRRLAQLEPQDVETYLADMGRAAGIKDWQLAQIVDAIQILLELARVEWKPGVFYRCSARSRRAHRIRR